MKSQLKSALLISATVAATFANATVMIDDFNTGAASSSLSSGFQYFSQAGSMVGGDRIVFISVTSNAFGLNMAVDTSVGVLSINSQSGVDGLGAVAYGLNLVNPTSTSFDDLNLNLSGENQFKIRTLSRDGDLTIRVNVRNGNGTNFTVSQTLFGSSINTAEDTFFNFASFTGVNFADVDQIQVDFDTANSGDVAVDYIQAVPEPATLTILGAAAAIAAARRRRNK
ncbi:MAG: PEP-CTERM sorting domain-containing protein [Fimbriimonadaceae bacterium]